MVLAALRTVVIPKIRTAAHPTRVAPALLAFRALDRHRLAYGGGPGKAFGAAPAAVSVERVSKGFRLPHQRTRRSRSGPCTRSRGTATRSLQALEDVSFEVKRRRVLRHRRPQRQRQEHAAQVPGRDLRRSTPATIDVSGRLSPFIELGVGFNPDLTARDNVVINAIMLGLTRRRGARALRRDHRVRRARGVRRPEAEELLVRDERAARRSRWRSRSTPTCCSSTRCWRWATRRSSRSASTSSSACKREGRTILFVTHDMSAVERFCDRAMLLERGRMVGDRPSRRGRRACTASSTSGSTAAAAEAARRATRTGPVSRALVRGRARRARPADAARGGSCRACFEVEFRERRSRIRCSRSRSATTCGTRSSSPPAPCTASSGRFEAGERATVRFAFENWLAPSRYTLTPVGRPRAAPLLSGRGGRWPP